MLLSLNGLSQVRVLLLQQVLLFAQNPLELPHEPMRNQLRTVKSEQSDVKSSRLGKSLHVTGPLVLDQMNRQIVKLRMQHALLRRDTVRIRPEVPLVLIAPRTGVNEIVLVIPTTGRPGTMVVNGETSP
jgi:hypothetical protein